MVEAGVSSFEISGEPLLELHIHDPQWREKTGLEELEAKIDMNARNATDKFTLALNKISLEVNRGQYEFRLTNGLLEATHDQEVRQI